MHGMYNMYDTMGLLRAHSHLTSLTPPPPQNTRRQPSSTPVPTPPGRLTWTCINTMVTGSPFSLMRWQSSLSLSLSRRSHPWGPSKTFPPSLPEHGWSPSKTLPPGARNHLTTDPRRGTNPSSSRGPSADESRTAASNLSLFLLFFLFFFFFFFLLLTDLQVPCRASHRDE
ncbi:hypothetical protein LZ31DRAFT_76606 [Colletotrichum somersetense]|nr:hypothetical protein LZ31DRAFT_76606 [Colletotrichum somersetense]